MRKPPDIVVKRFAKFLRELNETGMNGNPPMSEEELARIFGKSQSSISNYIRGSIGTITSDIILIAVNRYRVNPWYFFGNYEEDRRWDDFPTDTEAPTDPDLMDIESAAQDIMQQIRSLKSKGRLRTVRGIRKKKLPR